MARTKQVVQREKELAKAHSLVKETPLTRNEDSMETKRPATSAAISEPAANKRPSHLQDLYGDTPSFLMKPTTKTMAPLPPQPLPFHLQDYVQLPNLPPLSSTFPTLQQVTKPPEHASHPKNDSQLPGFLPLLSKNPPVSLTEPTGFLLTSPASARILSDPLSNAENEIPSTISQNGQSSVVEAAIAVLESMKVDFKGGGWPKNCKSFWSYFGEHLEHFSGSLQPWYKSVCSTGRPDDSNLQTAANRLVNFYKILGIVTGKRNSLGWILKRINILCNEGSSLGVAKLLYLEMSSKSQSGSYLKELQAAIGVLQLMRVEFIGGRCGWPTKVKIFKEYYVRRLEDFPSCVHEWSNSLPIGRGKGVRGRRHSDAQKLVNTYKTLEIITGNSDSVLVWDTERIVSLCQMASRTTDSLQHPPSNREHEMQIADGNVQNSVFVLGKVGATDGTEDEQERNRVSDDQDGNGQMADSAMDMETSTSPSRGQMADTAMDTSISPSRGKTSEFKDCNHAATTNERANIDNSAQGSTEVQPGVYTGTERPTTTQQALDGTKHNVENGLSATLVAQENHTESVVGKTVGPPGIGTDSTVPRQLERNMAPKKMVAPVSIENSAASLVRVLPSDLIPKLSNPVVQAKLSEVNLDLGRKPLAWLNGVRMALGATDNRIVTKQDLQAIEEKVGGFPGRDPARWDQQLHRIAAARGRQGAVIGITMQVGKLVTGNTAMISDLVKSHKSILLLGPTGSGKTSVLREISGELSANSKVCIVDTKNDIGGHGDIPHPAVGFANRLMVPGTTRMEEQVEQGNIMYEALRNYKPHVLLVDELRSVQAATFCKNSGVRLIASAKGDLNQIVRNNNLRGLVLNERELTGDAKLCSKPVFDCVVELSNDHTTFQVMMDPSEAAKEVLWGAIYSVETRIRVDE